MLQTTFLENAHSIESTISTHFHDVAEVVELKRYFVLDSMSASQSDQINTQARQTYAQHPLKQSCVQASSQTREAVMVEGWQIWHCNRKGSDKL